MRIDVTLFGISGNSLRWLRRLAPWSIIPVVLGGLVLATIALGSASRYDGAAYHSGYGRHQSMYGAALQNIINEQPQSHPQVLTVSVGENVNVLPQQGWSSITLQGTALQSTDSWYVAVHQGRAVLTAHQGQNHWKYTVVVTAPTH